MICLALGSNLGDRSGYLEQARSLLAAQLHTDMRASRVLETEALGFDGPPFLNQVLAFESGIAPEALLDLCQAIEIQLGREAHEACFDAVGRRVYANRTIDIDILFMDDLQLETDRLVLPHPQVEERPYIRQLLKDITI